MSYRSKYGVTKIKPKKMHNLQINWDWDYTPLKQYPVLLFTPDMDNTDYHYHIELNRTEAKKLKKWLDDFLKDTNNKGIVKVRR
jgi:hypothetical protein